MLRSNWFPYPKHILRIIIPLLTVKIQKNYITILKKKTELIEFNQNNEIHKI